MSFRHPRFKPLINILETIAPSHSLYFLLKDYEVNDLLPQFFSMSENKIKLQLFGLPDISSLDDLSIRTRLSKKIIYNCSKNNKYQYKEVSIPKKRGGFRLISMPNKKQKALQAWILRNILDKLSCSTSSVGFEKGDGILNNAIPHIGSNAMLCLDLKDFFGHIKSLYIYNIFKQLGYNSLISTILTRICTLNDSLPQGSPCSPKLANLYCISLDKRIQGFVGRRGIVYTRYADDITLSGPDDTVFPRIINTIIKIIEDEKLVVNNNKTRFSGYRNKKVTTGLVITKNSVGIGRERYRLLRSKIYRLKDIDQSELDNNLEMVNHIGGWISYMNYVDKRRKDKIILYIENLIGDSSESILKSLLKGK